MEPDTAAALAGSNPETWIGFARYVFDKAWPYLSVALASFLSGLAIKRPRALRKGSAE